MPSLLNSPVFPKPERFSSPRYKKGYYRYVKTGEGLAEEDALNFFPNDFSSIIKELKKNEKFAYRSSLPLFIDSISKHTNNSLDNSKV